MCLVRQVYDKKQGEFRFKGQFHFSKQQHHVHFVGSISREVYDCTVFNEGFEYHVLYTVNEHTQNQSIMIDKEQDCLYKFDST